ncbi:metallophosphoesterase [Phycisphaeraceae bacterium D3-23]
MPISLPPISRRRFIHSAAALAGAAALPQSVWALQDDERPDPHRLALFSDTHIDRNRATLGGNQRVNVYDLFARCIREAMAGRKPAYALVCGDCALDVGRPGDYEQFLNLTVAMLEQGVPVHCVLGNHDNTENFYEAGVARAPETPPVTNKHVTVVETARANWLLLDSLQETSVVSGRLGETQIGWIAETLDDLDDKPVNLMVHHNFDWTQRDGTNWGLRDADAFFEVISPANKVKSIFFGHSHNWQHSQRDDGIYLVNLPPTGYVFDRAHPNGWVDCHQKTDGLDLRLNCCDRRHAQHRERVEIEYR